MRRIIIYGVTSLLLLSSGCSKQILLGVTTVSDEKIEGLAEREIEQIESIKQAMQGDREDKELLDIIEQNPNYTLNEYLTINPEAFNPAAHDYRVGPYDRIRITVYEEPDLTVESQISGKGNISFPLLGRVDVSGKTPSEIEQFIARKLVEEKYILDAHVSAAVTEFKSKQYMILGMAQGGTYPLEARERVLDALAKIGGIDFEQGFKKGMIIRTLNAGTENETKIVIHIDLTELIRGGVQRSNLVLQDRDLIYIPKPEYYYVIGAVGGTGKFPYQEKEITLVEAIISAGGFAPEAATNRIRIIRVEDGVEKIYKINADAVVDTGKITQDFVIRPEDIIIVPESYF